MTIVIGIGTVKGAWFATSDDRQTWTISGPHHRGWEVNAFGRSPGGAYLLGTGSSWYGAAVHRSEDLAEWDQVVAGPAYDADRNSKLERIWNFAAANNRIYAGVADAGLFSSDDDANTWHPVTALNEHATRDRWQPGFGGLALHRIIVDPANPDRVWVAISAVGVFATTDGGNSWEPRNDGVQITVPGDESDIGYCVHCIVHDPTNPEHLWRQEHRGVFRSTNGGVKWQRIQSGIPGSGFGFPIVRDRNTGRLFVVPLESDEYRMPVDGHLAVYVSDDDGDTWTASAKGLPAEPTYVGVLRGAMDIDGLPTAGVYFGTTGGDVWWSADTGDSWERLPMRFPRITTVKVLGT